MSTVPTPSDGEHRRPTTPDRLPPLPGCGRTATARIELYSPRDGMLHGSLDGSLYVCDRHNSLADLSIATGLTPHRVRLGADGRPLRCGDGFDFLAMESFTAAAPDTTAAPAGGTADTPNGGPPAGDMFPACPPWCTTDHSERSTRFDLIEGWREHMGAGSSVELESGAATVDVVRFDHLGAAGDPRVLVCSDDSATPDNADRLAAAIIYAAQVARGVAA